MLAVAVVLVLSALLSSCERGYDYARVSRIGWEKETARAFSRAKLEDKPIFIYFSAIWCSWCREYEKELEEVASFIGERFVPLLLDADRDRDLFTRYGGRGTPFTVILSPGGEVLLRWNGSLSSEDLIALMRAEVETKPADGKHTYVIKEASQRSYKELLTHFLEDLGGRYDPVYGGFSGPSGMGKVFKWSTPLTYDYLLERGLLVEEVLFSLRKDIEFLYDEVDGGFFNFYDRSRAYDFYFETSKSLSVNALMIIALLEAYKKTGEELFLEKALGTYDYLKKTLFHEKSGCFLNAQVSDPSYYNLPREKRKKRKPPPTDTAIVVEYNSLSLLALLELYSLTQDEEFIRLAVRCARYILSDLFTGDALYRYIDVRNGKRGLKNNARDIAMLTLALSHLSLEEEVRKVMDLIPERKDWVSASVLALALSNRTFLEGLEVDLAYHNPDEFVFLLRALEVILFPYGKGLLLRHDAQGRLSGGGGELFLRG
ncbi:MAG TPA: thioredoxin domain-containing protein [Aquifex aeolicus]|nr:thioredoxin domain-containing protein [Aquifex aeolicus]